MAAVDQSLRRLGTDHIDLYQLHFDDPATPLDEVATVLDHLVHSGKVRYVGVSNFLAYRVARLLGRQDALRLVRLSSVQPRYSLLFREIERELLPLAREESIAMNVFNPLAAEILSGKYRADMAPTGRFAESNGFYGNLYRSRYWHQRQFDTIEQISAIARQRHVSLPTLAVAWYWPIPALPR